MGFMTVKVSRLYKIMADTIELIKTDPIINNHGIILKGLRKAAQSMRSDASREGRKTPPDHEK